MNLIWVTDAKYVSEYKINLAFNNGVTGIVDLEKCLNGKVFEPLKDTEYFKKFTSNSWTIEWENGADFAPEYLYSMIKNY